MQFQNPIVSGNTLVADAIQSENWDTGTDPRWRIAKDGTATFTGAVTGGSFATGVAPSARITIGPTGTPGGIISFYSAYNSPPDIEIAPASLYVDQASAGQLTIISDDQGSGTTELTLAPPQSGNPGAFVLENNSSETPARMILQTGFVLRLNDTSDVTLSSTDHAFQIGSSAGPNLCIDNNEIQARDVFAQASTLNLQNSGGQLNIGGTITCSDMRPVDGTASANITSTSTSLAPDNTNGPNFTFQYPPSGRVLVLISADADNTSVSFTNMSFRIRDTNAAGTVRFTGGSDETARHQGTGNRSTVATHAIVSGLPTSGTGFIEGMYAVSAGTGTWRNADIVVLPMV